MAWLGPIVEIAVPCLVDVDLWLQLGCESMLEVAQSCAVRRAMAAACGVTWRLLRNCGSVVEQEPADCMACHRGWLYRNS
jgi:hypothetical protein